MDYVSLRDMENPDRFGFILQPQKQKKSVPSFHIFEGGVTFTLPVYFDLAFTPRFVIIVLLLICARPFPFSLFPFPFS